MIKNTLEKSVSIRLHLPQRSAINYYLDRIVNSDRLVGDVSGANREPEPK